MPLLEYTVPCELPSMNEIIEKANLRAKKYQAYAQMKERYTLICKAVAPKIKLKKINTVFCKWFSEDRRKDKDNIRAGMKFILDGLVAAKVLKNDGYNYVGGFIDEFDVDKDNPRVEVTLYVNKEDVIG